LAAQIPNFTENVKVGQPRGVKGNLGFKNHAALRGVFFFSPLPRTYVLGYFLSLLRSSKFDPVSIGGVRMGKQIPPSKARLIG